MLLVVLITTTMPSLDLTPFGFTATESRVYGVLLRRGPSTGYAVAKELSIARTNAYHALGGLVAKGVADQSDSEPRRFRGVRPDAVFALIVDRQARKLDSLEAQLQMDTARGIDSWVTLGSERGLVRLATRDAVRSPGEVRCAGPQRLLMALAPAWRARSAKGLATLIWLIGEPEGDLPLQIAGSASEAAIRHYYGGSTFLFVTGESCVVAVVEGENASGYWSSDPVSIGSTAAAIDRLTST